MCALHAGRGGTSDPCGSMHRNGSGGRADFFISRSRFAVSRPEESTSGWNGVPVQSRGRRAGRWQMLGVRRDRDPDPSATIATDALVSVVSALDQFSAQTAHRLTLRIGMCHAIPTDPTDLPSPQPSPIHIRFSRHFTRLQSSTRQSIVSAGRRQPPSATPPH